MHITSVVESGAALQPERHCPPYHLDLAHHLAVFGYGCVAADGHVIGEFGDSVRRKNSRDENIRFRPIELFVSYFVRLRTDPEASASPVIENRAKHTW